MPKTLPIRPLTRDAFLPFGQVIEAEASTMKLINGGNTERFHALAEAEATGEAARVILNIFRGKPRVFPYEITMMERHPFGSQSFSPLNGRPYLVVVSKDENGCPATPQVFLARGDQGVNYQANVWHHPLMTIDAVSDFLVVDRDGPGNNLEEFFYSDPFVISAPIISE
jgi:ureidoglycolate lyase